MLFKKNRATKIEDIKNLTRFSKGTCLMDIYTLEYIDSLSTFNDYVDIFLNQIYHFECKKEYPLIFDLGGYIGVQTLYFKKIFPNSIVKVFEPHPLIIPILKRNILNNNLKNIEVLEYGVSNSVGSTTLYSDNADGSTVNSKGKKNPIEIKIEKLSKFINQPIDFLKMNIEGEEYHVFEDIENKLELIDQIIFEYHCFSDLDQNLHKILTILHNAGFSYLVTDATSAKIQVPFKLNKPYKYFNLIYAKKNT